MARKTPLAHYRAMSNLLRLTNPQARAIFLERHALGSRPSGPGTGADLAGLVHQLGFVQLDSINTVARAHHMILHARRQSYRQGALDRVAFGARQGFEHWTHDASMIAMEFYPHWRHKMTRSAAKLKGNFQNWRRDGFEEKFDAVLEQIAAHGPCCSADVGTDEKRGSGGWWDWHPSKTALEYLWRSGALSVCHRQGFRKYYDLTERVIPAEVLAQETELQETVDWACHAALTRLGFGTSGEIAKFWELVTKEEARDWCAKGLAQGHLQEIEIEAADGQTRKSLAFADIETRLDTAQPPGMARVLSPFDPALRDRTRAERLFGFHYRIEVFVPEAKRQYGYYVFPVLEGDHLMGRIDMKCDSASGVMTVRAFWPEAGMKMGQHRLKRLHAALERTARLAGSDEIRFAADWLRG